MHTASIRNSLFGIMVSRCRAFRVTRMSSISTARARNSSRRSCSGRGSSSQIACRRSNTLPRRGVIVSSFTRTEVFVPARKKSIVVIPIVIIIAAIAAFLYYRYSRKPQEVVLSGTLEARTVNVGSLVGGRVTKTLIDEGMHVTAGQLLVTLETETIDRQILEQRAAIAAAQAALAKAIAGPRPEEIAKAAAVASNDEIERRRQERLYRYGIVAKELAEEAATKAKPSAQDLRILQKGTRKEDIDAARADVEAQQRKLETLMK